MNEFPTQEALAERFEADRSRLRSVAYRMLGSLAEADDAVQEAWLRLDRSDTTEVQNLSGWLTTVVARVCLDQLRSRKSRREDLADMASADETEAEATASAAGHAAADPEKEALLADSVGVALLVVLDSLNPAERLSFVLHDMFGVSFDEIAPIVDRTPAAARQLASRARRRVQDTNPHTNPSAVPDRPRQRTIVEAFLTASRKGDFTALLDVLDPDVVFRGDQAAVLLGGPAEMRGRDAVAKAFLGRAQGADAVELDGVVGARVGSAAHIILLLRISFSEDGAIRGIEAVAEPDTMADIELVEFAD